MKNIIIIILFVSSCTVKYSKQQNQNSNKLTYLFVGYTRHTVDTIYKSIINKEFSDSVYQITYRNFNLKEHCDKTFEFPLSNFKASFQNLRDTSNFKLSLLDTKTIHYQSSKYTVYKYLYNNKNYIDEETLYFFVPEFGIIIQKSACWGNYDRLINNGIESETNNLFYIGEMILFDSNFFHKW